MFTFISFVLVAGASWLADRQNDKERRSYAGEEHGLLLLHIRQDLKLIALTLASIVIMLGIVADLHH
jgi:hypothetical protein